MKPLVLAVCLLAPLAGAAAESLAPLVGVLGRATHAQMQVDILRGLREATEGRGAVPMPEGWADVEARLLASDRADVRALTRSLGLTFGSARAREAVRAAVGDTSLDAGQRQDALRSLVSTRAPELPGFLRGLLSDPVLRGAAIRALAGFDDVATPSAVLEAYPRLAGSERRDALGTLASRAGYARVLLEAVEGGRVSSRDLTAEVVRQLRGLKDEQVNLALTRVYGAVREVAADRQAEIERYKRLYWAGGSTPGEAISGRTVYARVCQQCHVLFGVGGKVGPDLTGSNRGDLDYVLQNILDPNAVIPNEYVASTVELKDGRVITGIVQRQDDVSLTVATATETVTVRRAEVADTAQSQLSMMPEGLLAPLTDQEVRDLIYYLGRPGQTPLLATPETSNLFFNEHDLALWQGDEEVWGVREGLLVGRHTPGRGPSVLRSEMVASDFRLAFEARVPGPGTVLELVVRGEPQDGGVGKGYAIPLGPGPWKGLRAEGGRELEGARAPSAVAREIRAGEWGRWEVVAEGNHLRVRREGQTWAEVSDPAGPRRGITALRLSGGGGVELRRLALEAKGGSTEAVPR